MIKKVAFIGVGYMGYGIAKNLIIKNFNLKVIAHKNKKPIDKLKKIGAIEVHNYEDLLKDIDCLFLCVTNTPIAISIAKEIKYELQDIDLESDLYHASRQVFINILSKQRSRNIAMVGHNPGIQDFSYWLCSEPTINFPTCGVIHISFSLENWKEIYKNSGKVISFEYPKMFI